MQGNLDYNDTVVHSVGVFIFFFPFVFFLGEGANV